MSMGLRDVEEMKCAELLTYSYIRFLTLGLRQWIAQLASSSSKMPFDLSTHPSPPQHQYDKLAATT